MIEPSNEAVEALARHKFKSSVTSPAWEDCPSTIREGYLRIAREDLLAALPIERQRWEQEVRERLETKAKALNTRAEARFEDGDQQEANQLIAFATGIQIALDLIFGEAEQVGGDDV